MSLPISVRSVSRRFGATVALVETSLEIQAGEFLALVGPSGCGKSTLLRLVAGLDTQSDGTILVGQQTSDAARQQRVFGVASQRPAVLPWARAIDDVRFTQQLAGHAGFPAGELLAQFGLAGHEHKRPRELSGGMVQRVNIASAIAHDPAVLLLDEPFAALDELKREELGDWLGQILYERGRTVLFVTHHVDEAVLLADRVAVMSPAPGRIVALVDVPGQRPRPPAFRRDPRFVETTARIRDLLLSGAEVPV
jgi:NitT/TauT family transport system ATP-binding protein